MGKYIFDLNIGHYILNEAEDTNNEATQSTDNNDVVDVMLPTLTTPDVVNAQEKMQRELDTLDKDISRLINNKTQLEENIAEQTQNFEKATGIDKSNIKNQVVQLNNKLLQVLFDIAKKEKDKAEKKYNYTQNILQLQQKVNESMKRVLPAKYKDLNEEELNNAKIYMRDIIKNDNDHIIKEMKDFMRVFGNTDLLYGRDKNGYFVICTDSDDVNKMHYILESVGYNSEFIRDNILPQLL